MSASKSKTKETSQQTQTSSGTATTTPNTPDWLAQPWQQQVGSISALQNSGQPLLAGAQPLQEQAFKAASGLNGDGRMVNGGPGDGYTAPGGFNLAQSLGLSAASAPANTATAQGYTPSMAQNVNIAPTSSASSRNLTDIDLEGYFNPYEQQVIDTTSADYDVSSGRARAAEAARAAANGGGRNSNNAIQASLLGGEIERGRGSLIAGLRNAGYDRATSLAMMDLAREAETSRFNAGLESGRSSQQAQLDQAGVFSNQGAANSAAQFGATAQNNNSMFNASQGDNALQRQLEAAGLIGNLSSAQGADTRANIGLQADLGGQQRDIANSQTDAASLALIQQLLGGVPLEAFLGQTETRNQTGSGTGTGTTTSGGFGFNLADLWSASNSGR